MIICTIVGVNYSLAEKTHIVQRGESIESISKKYNISSNDLIGANPGVESLFYIGLKLNIPEIQSSDLSTTKQSLNEDLLPSDVTSTGKSGEKNYKYHNDSFPKMQEVSFESQRRDAAFEIGYSAWSFKYAKKSGSYGVSWISLPWKIEKNLYAGFYISPLNLNCGLGDYTADIIKLGPALGYYLTPQIFVAMPLNVECFVYFANSKKIKPSWGMELAPSVYLGSKYGIYLGPLFTLSFTDGSDISCGFRVGFYL